MADRLCQRIEIVLIVLVGWLLGQVEEGTSEALDSDADGAAATAGAVPAVSERTAKPWHRPRSQEA